MAMTDKLIKLEQLHRENQLEIDLLKQQMNFVMEFLKDQFGIKFEFNNHQSVPKIIKIESYAGIGMENVRNNYQGNSGFQDDKDSLLFGQYIAGIQSVHNDNEVLATEIGNSSVGFGLENSNDTIDDSENDQSVHEDDDDDEDNEDYSDDDSLSALQSILCDTGSREPSTSQIEEIENYEGKNAGGNDDLPDFEKNQPYMRSESNQTKTCSVKNPYICDWKNCGKRFTRRDGLNCHKNTHTGEKPFKCDWQECGSRFAYPRSLRQHKKSHTGEKPFNCGYCNAAFQRKAGLEDHLRTHTGEAPFQCDQCGRSFKRRSILKKHKYTHLPRA